MSDAVIKARTGCTWETPAFKVPDWWTQTVTGGYELQALEASV